MFHLIFNLILRVAKHGEEFFDDIFVEEMRGENEAKDKEKPEAPLRSIVGVQAQFFNHRALVESFLHHLDQQVDGLPVHHHAADPLQ